MSQPRSALGQREECRRRSRVVTAPADGAAVLMLAVLRFYKTLIEHAWSEGATEEGAHTFLPTAEMISKLYQKRAPITAVDVSCQR